MFSLMVRNVPTTLGDQDLRRIFGRFGQVDRVVTVSDDRRRHPTRRVFVDMATDRSARNAMQRVDGREVAGSRLAIEAYAPFD